MKEKLIAGFIELSAELAFLVVPMLIVSAFFMVQSIKSGNFLMLGSVVCVLGVGLDVVCHLINVTLDYMLEDK